MSNSVQPYGPLAHQVPLSRGFSRQEYWSGLPRPSPGDLPDPGIEPMSFMSKIIFFKSLWNTVTSTMKALKTRAYTKKLEKQRKFSLKKKTLEVNLLALFMV